MTDEGADKPRLYNRVQTLRREEGLTRKEVCAVLGVSQQTLANIEREEREPGVLLAWRIATYFGLPLEAVFSDSPVRSLKQVLADSYSESDHRPTDKGREECS